MRTNVCQIVHGVDDTGLKARRVRDFEQGVHVVEVDLPETEDGGLVWVHTGQGGCASWRTEQESTIAFHTTPGRAVQCGLDDRPHILIVVVDEAAARLVTLGTSVAVVPGIDVLIITSEQLLERKNAMTT